MPYEVTVGINEIIYFGIKRFEHWQEFQKVRLQETQNHHYNFHNMQ